MFSRNFQCVLKGTYAARPSFDPGKSLFLQIQNAQLMELYHPHYPRITMDPAVCGGKFVECAFPSQRYWATSLEV